MANTYTQLYIQYVFAVKHREKLIKPKHKEELQKYMTGIIQNQNHKMLAVSCMPDHTHILIGMKPVQSIADLVQNIKMSASLFINEKNWFNGKFSWQDGYGAFSYGHSQLDDVIQYILNQEEHHRKKTFRNEYLEFLEKFAVSYDDRYVFEFFD